MRLLLLTFILFSTVELFGQSQTVEPYKFPQSLKNINADIDFLTTGDKFYKVTGTSEQFEQWKKDSEYDGSYRYRVSFVLSEIYYSILIEKTQLPWKEGDARKVIEQNFYTGFDIAENILEYGRLTNLDFKEWKDFRTFELAESDDEIIEIQILTNGKIKVTKK
ncbi:MAG: hypothetical protein JXR10_13200 [Cyclobacteriaceae bacterium]